MPYRVLLNSGAAKIYLQQTAEDLELANQLEGFIGGFILSENSKIRGLIKELPVLKKILSRSRGLKNRKLIHISFFGEFYWQIAIFLQNSFRRKDLSSFFFWLSSKSFSMTAIRYLRRKSATELIIYHVRSGFGGRSVDVARNLGYKIIVDHSIAHPNFLSEISGNVISKKRVRCNIENIIRQDLDNADLVLVNSEFVYQTFIGANFPGDLGIAIPPIEAEFAQLLRTTNTKREGITFIGRCEYRKGIDRTLEIIRELDESIKVTIVGNWDSDSLTIRRNLEALPNVKLIPFADRIRIAEILTSSKIFLFPSRAEGAARVVGEALHAGCAVITTRESGVPVPLHSGMVINGKSISEIVTQIMIYLEADRDFDLISDASRDFIAQLEKEYFETLTTFYRDFY